MTGPAKARAYSAAQNTEAATGPLQFGDKCFLCSRTINIDTPPVEPREFYIGKNGGMYLCHQTCLNEMNAAGGTPKDFHAARRAAGKPEVEPEANQVQINPPVQEQGAGWLHFEKLADLTAYTTAKGQIDESVKVTVGTSLIQAGE